MSEPVRPVRLVALDLDGTLLNRRSQITPRTRAAILAASQQGVVVVPATGRSLSTLPPEVAQLPGIRYALTTNGAAVWDLGSDPMSAVYSRYADAENRRTTQPVCLLQRLFPPQKAREVFGLCQQYEGELTIFSDGRGIKDKTSQALAAARMARHCSTEADQPYDGRFTVVPDFAEWMSRQAHSIEKFCLFFGSVEKARAALPAFRRIEGVEVVQGSPDNVEVTALGVDKGEALLALADQLGIPRSQTMAVGDSENDRALLEKAGVSAAMANAMPSIRALADHVSEADCDADGVAELFEKLVLTR